VGPKADLEATAYIKICCPAPAELTVHGGSVEDMMKLCSTVISFSIIETGALPQLICKESGLGYFSQILLC
jgi:hypothetical protein